MLPLPSGLPEETSGRNPHKHLLPQKHFSSLVVLGVSKGLRILPTDNIKQVQKERAASATTP